MRSSRHASRDENAFRPQRIGEIEYYRSRVGFGDASIEAYRFPCQRGTSGRDFVLVHGIGVSARAFGPTAVLLARHGDVHLLDLAGYGRSPKPARNLTIAEHADLLARYLVARSLDHPTVVGHSMGAQVVAELAARRPELVDHAVLIAPVMTPDARTLLPAARQMLRDALREPPTISAVATLDYLIRSGLSYSSAQTPHLLGHRIEDVMPRIEAKTLVICGTEDPISPPEWGRALAQELPRGWFDTARGAHGAMWVAPKKIAALIDEHAKR